MNQILLNLFNKLKDDAQKKKHTIFLIEVLHSVIFKRITANQTSIKAPLWGWKRSFPLQLHLSLRCPWCWTALTNQASSGLGFSYWDPATAMLPLVIHQRVVITVGGGVTLLPTVPDGSHRSFNQTHTHTHTNHEPIFHQRHEGAVSFIK